MTTLTIQPQQSDFPVCLTCDARSFWRPRLISCYQNSMRLTSTTVADALAWAALAALIGVAVATVSVLGPFGLIILGLLTLFVCTSISLRDDNPTWGPEVFKAQTNNRVSPEQRAAMHEERQRTLAPLPFYRWCGIALIVAGIAGFAWQFRQ